jgi:hypothetical protein
MHWPEICCGTAAVPHDAPDWLMACIFAKTKTPKAYPLKADLLVCTGGDLLRMEAVPAMFRLALST